MKAPTISLAATQAMMEAMLPYVPMAQRENARSAALAAGIGHAYGPKPSDPADPTHRKPGAT